MCVEQLSTVISQASVLLTRLHETLTETLDPAFHDLNKTPPTSQQANGTIPLTNPDSSPLHMQGWHKHSMPTISWTHKRPWSPHSMQMFLLHFVSLLYDTYAFHLDSYMFHLFTLHMFPYFLLFHSLRFILSLRYISSMTLLYIAKFEYTIVLYTTCLSPLVGLTLAPLHQSSTSPLD